MQKKLFTLTDGTPVYYGDILYPLEQDRIGWYCRAEFEAEGDVVTVRSPNGAVPTVQISNLCKEPPPVPERCKKCGQLLPN